MRCLMKSLLRMIAENPANFRKLQTGRKQMSLIYKDFPCSGSLHADVCGELPQSSVFIDESTIYLAPYVCMRTSSYYVGEGVQTPSLLRGGLSGLGGQMEVGQ